MCASFCVVRTPIANFRLLPLDLNGDCDVFARGTKRVFSSDGLQ